MALNHLFMHAPNAMLLIDHINNRIVQANQAALRLFSLENDKLASYTVSQLFSHCLPKLHNFTLQVLLQGEAWSTDLAIAKISNDEYLDIHAVTINEHILFSCQSSHVAFKRFHQSMIEDNYQAGLQHWRAKETIFQEIERHNQLLLTAVGDGIYGVDAQGNTTFVNAAAEQILGWQREELAGEKIHQVIHHTHANGHHYDAKECPIYAAFNDGEVHRVDDEVFWAKNGIAVPVEYTSTPVTENGLLIGAVVIFRDISERKRIQSKLMAALTEVDALKSRLEMEKAYLLEEINADFNHHQIIGQSAKVQHMVQQIELVGPTNANVLITGESGTGKELIARAIHDVSERHERPLIRVNCAAIPADLFESEFFGHVKGAFSGAISDRVGRFELADGATIFLDEVGEIPLLLQGKLLRVLQEQQFERVGESTTRHINVRVISATNQDLEQLVKANKFREDLYFRLNVFPIHSPALRERKEDLPLLVKHFMDKACRDMNQQASAVSVAQMSYLTHYDWPGNIRELENIIERQLILAKGNRVTFDFLTQQVKNPKQVIDDSNTPTILNTQQQKALEKNNLEQALKQCKGKIYGDDGAATLLGLKPTTFASKLKKYHINRQHYTR